MWGRTLYSQVVIHRMGYYNTEYLDDQFGRCVCVRVGEGGQQTPLCKRYQDVTSRHQACLLTAPVIGHRECLIIIHISHNTRYIFIHSFT